MVHARQFIITPPLFVISLKENITRIMYVGPSLQTVAAYFILNSKAYCR